MTTMARALALTIFLAAPAAGETLTIRGADGAECAAFAIGSSLLGTAAHCATSNTFALRGGQAVLVARGVFDSPYLTETEQTAEDIAILRTNAPLPPPVPLSRGETGLGATLILEPPGAAPRVCRVNGRSGDAYDLSCEVELGWSGAPLYGPEGFFGRRHVVGILSGRLGAPGENGAVMVHAGALSRMRAGLR